MGAPVLNGPFTMPMFRSFVPKKMQPWIYVVFAFMFQISGGVYLGALNEMVGGHSLLREDLQMCLYSNLAGMAIFFPVLFRMKFRFTNKTLLTASALGILVCNLVVPYITFLPLLWAVCFIEGICKIEGTFECMSTIQLWMTPKRDFTAFFPMLHIVILGSMQLSDLITTGLMYYYHWTYMHLFTAAMMFIMLIVLTCCVRHFRFMRKFPLFGIDWLGGALWAALLLEVAALFDYGEYLDWWNSPVTWQLTIVIIANLGFCIWRMLTIRHPYYDPKIWSYRHYIPLLCLITLVEIILGTEHVVEEMFYDGVMHYEAMVSTSLDWYAIAGILAGCLFAYWWMHIRRYNYLRLIIIGMIALTAYLVGFYFTVSSEIHITQLAPMIICRSFAYAILSATFMVCLEEMMTFQHFFQGLSVFNMLHMIVGGVIGGAIYSRMMNYYVPDNLARYGASVDSVAVSRNHIDLASFMQQFTTQVMEISIKQIYGWVIYLCAGLLLLFLLYDTPVRRNLKLMPYWKSFAGEVKQGIWRMRNKKI